MDGDRVHRRRGGIPNCPLSFVTDGAFSMADEQKRKIGTTGWRRVMTNRMRDQLLCFLSDELFLGEYLCGDYCLWDFGNCHAKNITISLRHCICSTMQKVPQSSKETKCRKCSFHKWAFLGVGKTFHGNVPKALDTIWHKERPEGWPLRNAHINRRVLSVENRRLRARMAD